MSASGSSPFGKEGKRRRHNEANQSNRHKRKVKKKNWRKRFSCIKLINPHLEVPNVEQCMCFLFRSGRLCNLSISSVSLPSSSHQLCSLPHYSALVLVWSDPFLFSKTALAYCALMQDAATKTMLIKGMKLNRLQRRALRHTPRRGALLPSKRVEVENGWGQTNC